MIIEAILRCTCRSIHPLHLVFSHPFEQSYFVVWGGILWAETARHTWANCHRATFRGWYWRYVVGYKGKKWIFCCNSGLIPPFVSFCCCSLSLSRKGIRAKPYISFFFPLLRFDFCALCLSQVPVPIPTATVAVLNVPNAESRKTGVRPHQQDQNKRKWNKRSETNPVAAQARSDPAVITVEKHVYWYWKSSSSHSRLIMKYPSS